MFKRLLLAAVVLLGIATGVLFTFGDRLAGALVRRVLNRATIMAASRGVQLREFKFTNATITGLGVIRCDQLAGTIHLPATGALQEWRRSYGFAAAYVVIDGGWPWGGRARVALHDGHLAALDSASLPTGEQLTRIQVQLDFPFSWWRPTASASLLEEEARRLITDGQTRLPMEFSAVASFKVASHRQDLPLRTEATGSGGARICVDRADIERLSRDYLNPLTQTEIDLVTRFPQRAPALLRICEKALRTALDERRRDRKFPLDAFRHVYWSWLLTKEFGPAFSETVTDAHEIGATYEVGASSRRMDLHNNAVGRAYALADVPEGEILSRVLNDSNVMRAPAAAPVDAPRWP